MSEEQKEPLENLLEAARMDDIETIEDLLSQKQVCIDEMGQSCQRTALMIAAGWKCLNALNLLLRRGADPNVVDIDRETALHIAAENKAVKVAKALLRSGSAVDPVDKDGFTPFHIACSEGDLKCAHLLLLAGANMQKYTNTGQTGLDLALEHRQQNIIHLLNGWDPSFRSSDAMTAASKQSRLNKAVSTWTEYDVECFFTHIDLPQYYTTFSSYHVDGSQLLTLTDADLETTFMITNTIHRRTILKAVEQQSLRLHKNERLVADDDEFELPIKHSPTKLGPVVHKKSVNRHHMSMKVANARNLRNQLLRDVERSSVSALKRPVNPRRRKPRKNGIMKS